MSNRLVARLAGLLSAMLTNAEVEAILNKHLNASDKAKGVDAVLVDTNRIRVFAAGMARRGK